MHGAHRGGVQPVLILQIVSVVAASGITRLSWFLLAAVGASVISFSNDISCIGEGVGASSGIFGPSALTGWSSSSVSEVVLSIIVVSPHLPCVSVIFSGNPIFRRSVSCNSLVCGVDIVDSCMSGGVCVRTSSLDTGVSDSGTRLAVPVSSFTSVVELM